MSSDTGAADVSGVVTVGIPVADQDRALRFYREVLGLVTHLDVATPGGGRWLTVGAPGASGTTLALLEARDGLPAGVETGIRLSTPDAERAHTLLSAAGVPVDEVLRWPGVPPMFSFRDPDGNGLELVEDSPAGR